MAALAAGIDPIAAAQLILRHIPAPLPQLPFLSTPDFSAIEPLAAFVGAQPAGQVLRNAANLLGKDRDTIVKVFGQASSLVFFAAKDLSNIVVGLIRDTQPLIPLLSNPATAIGAGIKIAVQVGWAVTQAGFTLNGLANDLAPLAKQLAEIVTHAASQPAIAASSQAKAAMHELERHITARDITHPKQEVTQLAAVQQAGPPPARGGSAAGEAAVAAAKQQLGTRYAWGGSAPGGFDCSGLTSWAYQQAGVELPRLAQEQNIGQQVRYEDLQPGDLAVWDGHVAMYAGDGMLIEAGDPVQMNPVRTENMGMAFKGFWRPTA